MVIRELVRFGPSIPVEAVKACALFGLHMMAEEDSWRSDSGSSVSSTYSCEDNVCHDALHVIGLHEPGDKISLFLQQDWDVAKVALSCHIALDMLCQELHEVGGDVVGLVSEPEPVCLSLSNFVADEHFVLNGMRLSYILLCLFVCFFEKVERWTCPPFEEFGVLRSCDVSFSFLASELRSDVNFSTRFSFVFSSHRRANTGLNHVVRVSNHKKTQSSTRSVALAHLLSAPRFVRHALADSS